MDKIEKIVYYKIKKTEICQTYTTKFGSLSLILSGIYTSYEQHSGRT